MTRKAVYFGALLEQRLSRRGFLAASGAAAATGALPALGAGADTTHSATVKSYTALAPSLEDALRLSPGWRSQVVVGFGTLDRQFDILRHSCEIGLLALAATPKKSAKEGKGEVDVPLKVLGVEVLPGSFLLADEDGLLLLPEPPSGVRSGG